MVNKTEDDIAVPADVTAEATLAEQSGDPERGDNANDVVGAGGVEVIKAATFDSRTAITASLKDHFTLHVASSLVRYRDVHCAARVIQNLDSQFILEESYDPKAKVHGVSIRQIPDSSEGVKLLRLSYAIVAAFWTGFLFIFCLQVLLFLVLDLAIEIGATSNQAEADWGAALGVIFSIIPFVYGLASALVIAGAFIKDTWSGHVLVRSFTLRGWSDVVVEWIFFAFFLGLPLLLMGVMLLAKSDIWWQVTSLFWLSSVIFFFVLFTANVIFYEMRACWEITRNWREDDIDSYWELIKKSVLLRQMSAYSGRQTISYLSMGSIIDAEYTDKSKSERNMVAETQAVSLSWRAKLTNWDFLERLGLYEKIETAERIYTVDDARDIRPFVTSQSWSLEKIFCRPKDSRYIAIVKGPGALSRMQMRSSLVCSLIGNFLIFLLILALLTWLELGGVFTCLILAVGVIVALPGLKSSYKLFKITKQLVLATSDADERTTREDYQGETTSASEGVYLVVENYRVSRATPRLCCMMLAIEIGLFFVWPLISLFGVGNYPLGIFFIIVTGFTGMRYYVNAAVVLEETGRMDLVDGDTEKELWKNESRLNSIVGDITRGRSRSAWISILGFFGFTFVALFLGAIGQQEEDTAVKPYAYLPDFVYEQKDSLRYPSCELTSDLGESPLTAIADYAFLAGLAYRDVNGTQAALDGWFGPSGQNATDRNAIVEDWRDVNDIQSAVSFKLVTFPDNGNFAYVLIRGTQNNWDMLTDVQLWGAAALMQTLRLLLPVGEIWTPIIAQLIQVITKLESKSIDRVSFYKVTSQFVRFLKEQTTYLGVGITGHSLGGGLAIITGAQTGTPAVALSGPNAMLSRKSFDPPVSSDDLDSKTFNIIPARDLVPMLDDVAQNFQKIRCEAGANDPIGCHDSTRSLCEIMFTCGSQMRPPLCECVRTYGYDEPKQINMEGRTFDEACPKAVE